MTPPHETPQPVTPQHSASPTARPYASFRVVAVHSPGAEDVVVATSGPDEGAVYTGTEDGGIVRVSHDGSRVSRVASTNGRPLGIEMLPDGRLLVCDAHRGLLAVDARTGPGSGGGAVQVLATEADGTPLRFCNNAAVAGDGTIFFSDSSAHHGIEEWKADFVRNTRSGRLLRRTPDGDLAVLEEGLAFANGVALAADESWVAVAETGARTVVRRWLTGPRAGTRDRLCDDLPGYPDNIALGTDGLVWVTLASPRDPIVERLQRGPLWSRKASTRIPQRLQPKPKRTIRVQAFDATGALVRDIDVDHPSFHMVTGVREHEGRLWLGSLHEPAVASLDL